LLKEAQMIYVQMQNFIVKLYIGLVLGLYIDLNLIQSSCVER
jgi:hypothetical protein